jgi:hypothetical protein
MDTTRPKPFVFVLMPFSADFDDVYQFGIKPACVEAGGYCERVDEQIFEGNILERIYNQIGKADLIVADMTGRNPNVFYEVGYAHGLRKRVILLTQNSDDIPFDLKHYPHIVYSGSIAKLKRDLLPRATTYLKSEDFAPLAPESHRLLEFYVEHQLVSEGAIIDVSVTGGRFVGTDMDQHYVIKLVIGVRNPTETMVQLDFRAGLLFPPQVQKGRYGHAFEEIRLSDRKLQLMFGSVLARAYWPLFETSDELELLIPVDFIGPSQSIPVVLRRFLRYGVDDIEFSLRAGE